MSAEELPDNELFAFYRDAASKVLCAGIRARRKELNVSQERLAEALGQAQSWVARLETGQIRMTVPRFMHVACVLADLEEA